jgi:hypothetical protein
MRGLLIAFCLVTSVALLAPSDARAFSAGPASLELSGSRGKVVEDTFMVANVSGQPETYYFSTLKFRSSEDSGAPDFIPYDEDHSGLAEWIAFPGKSVTVPPLTKVDVPFTIVVPSDAPAGGHYAAIVVSDTPSDVVASNGTSISAKTALLVFLTIEGETREQAALLDFTVERTGRELEGMYRFRIQNQGNVFVIPTGTITLRNVFGATIGSARVNEDGGRILPESTRAFEGGWKASIFAVGPITASLDLTYGSAPELLSGQYAFSYWPMEFFLAVIITAASLAFIVIALQRRKR